MRRIRIMDPPDERHGTVRPEGDFGLLYPQRLHVEKRPALDADRRSVSRWPGSKDTVSGQGDGLPPASRAGETDSSPP